MSILITFYTKHFHFKFLNYFDKFFPQTFKLISPSEIIHSLKLTGVYGCHHISCATSDQVWVSDYNNLILTDITGVLLHRVKDFSGYLNYFGAHTVNSENELFYIDRFDNINTLSKDMKITSTFIKRTYSSWRPWCVLVPFHWKSTGRDASFKCNERQVNHVQPE